MLLYGMVCFLGICGICACPEQDLHDGRYERDQLSAIVYLVELCCHSILDKLCTCRVVCESFRIDNINLESVIAIGNTYTSTRAPVKIDSRPGYLFAYLLDLSFDRPRFRYTSHPCGYRRLSHTYYHRIRYGYCRSVTDIYHIRITVSGYLAIMLQGNIIK